METSRCLKYGRINETVPRHVCNSKGCEFDDQDALQKEIELWESLDLTWLADYSRRKLKFSQERAGKA